MMYTSYGDNSSWELTLTATLGGNGLTQVPTHILNKKLSSIPNLLRQHAVPFVARGEAIVNAGTTIFTSLTADFLVGFAVCVCVSRT